MSESRSLPPVEGVAFREAVGFPGYLVGDDGSVWSSKAPFGRTGRWRRLKQSWHSAGYLLVGLRGAGQHLVRQVFEPGLGEDVAVWQGGRQLVAVFRSDGRVVWLDRARVAM